MAMVWVLGIVQNRNVSYLMGHGKVYYFGLARIKRWVAEFLISWAASLLLGPETNSNIKKVHSFVVWDTSLCYYNYILQ